MFHSIITILTTAAVALHAVLGCCMHHAHSYVAHESELAVGAPADADDHCSHDHHHHVADGNSSSVEYANECDHEHDNGGHRECDGDDCSFTSVRRNSDLEVMVTCSMWCQTLGDATHANAMCGHLSLNFTAEVPPDPLSLSGSARAKTQVWRL